MNEQTEKTSSALAIPEKKPHRPGGCVGIFFQLFDWNRRFAKKKLFSRKLLPPAPGNFFFFPFNICNISNFPFNCKRLNLF